MRLEFDEPVRLRRFYTASGNADAYISRYCFNCVNVAHVYTLEASDVGTSPVL